MKNTSRKLKKYILVTCGIILFVAVLIIGYGVYSFSQMPEMFRLNKKCQEQGYYMGEFEFKLLGIVRWLDTGHYVKAVTELNKYHEQLKTKKGLIKLPDFKNKEEQFEFYLSLQNPETGAFMDDSFPFCEYAGPTSNVLLLLEALAKQTGKQLKLKYPLRFLDQINTPGKMKSYLDDISTVGWLGTMFPQTSFHQCRDVLGLYYEDDVIERNGLYSMPPETKTALLEWFYENQNPETGLWGPKNKKGELVNKDTMNSSSILKAFVDNNGNDRFKDFPVRYKDKLAESFLSSIKPIPNDEETDQWHEWGLDTSKSIRSLTRYLWKGLSEKSKQKAKTIIEEYIGIKFEKFYIKEEGAFSYYPESKHATLDGSSFITSLRDYGYCSEKNQIRLWGVTKKTITNEKEYNISSFTEADFHMDLDGINSIRFYAVEPKTVNCIDNVLGIFYPQKTNVLDAMELIPRMQNWVDNTKQSMGNWVSKTDIEEILQKTGIKSTPVLKQNLPVKELNDVLQENKKLILIGFDTLQIPIVENVYNLN